MVVASKFFPVLTAIQMSIVVDHGFSFFCGFRRQKCACSIHKSALLKDPVTHIARLLLRYFIRDIWDYFVRVGDLLQFRWWGRRAREVHFQSPGQRSEVKRLLLSSNVLLISDEILKWTGLIDFLDLFLIGLPHNGFYLDTFFILGIACLMIMIDELGVQFIGLHEIKLLDLLRNCWIIKIKISINSIKCPLPQHPSTPPRSHRRSLTLFFPAPLFLSSCLAHAWAPSWPPPLPSRSFGLRGSIRCSPCRVWTGPFEMQRRPTSRQFRGYYFGFRWASTAGQCCAGILLFTWRASRTELWDHPRTITSTPAQQFLWSLTRS